MVNLIKQVSPADVPIAVAAGIGPVRQDFGTDAVEISEAIQSVYSEDGVAILMDLGSAILSAEMALELLPNRDDKAQRLADRWKAIALTPEESAALQERIRREREILARLGGSKASSGKRRCAGCTATSASK